MIIRDNKGYEENSNFPDTNFCPNDPRVLFIIDQTTVEGKELTDKIREFFPTDENGPYYDFVTNEEGELIDIIDLRIQAVIDIPQASVDQVVTVTATLPIDTQDTEVIFKVEDGPDIIEPVSNDTAEHPFAFSAPGNYTITVTTPNHGCATVEVTVA